MSGANPVTFEKNITLGNLMQMLVLVVGMIAAYYVVKADIQTNRDAIYRLERTVEQNSEITRKIDVIENELSHIAGSLDRLEKKLDD